MKKCQEKDWKNSPTKLPLLGLLVQGFVGVTGLVGGDCGHGGHGAGNVRGWRSKELLYCWLPGDGEVYRSSSDERIVGISQTSSCLSQRQPVGFANLICKIFDLSFVVSFFFRLIG